MRPCTCGHALEEHGGDPEYPGSTACTECGDCIAYEADPGEEDAPPPKAKPPRSPSATERRALEVLAKKPTAASMVGPAIWTERRGRVVSTNGGGDYGAQMLLGRMRRQGWCRVQHGEGSSVWEITPSGRAALAAPPPLRLTRVQRLLLVKMMLVVKTWHILPGPEDIEAGCHVAGTKGWTLGAIAEAMNVFRDLTKPPFTERSIGRPLTKLVDLGLVARVFLVDEPEGSDPIYTITAAGAADHRRRNP